MADILDRLKAALADRYQIEGELGSGGMATVYLAQDSKHERQVAVKVLRPELAASLGAGRFLREIKITANLNHPRILPLLDSGEADGFLFYVMPYVEGESLRDRLKREKQLAIEDALKIAGEVADALGFAHDRNVIHRDIKPENILLEAKHAVVADFGVARAIEEAGEARLTETGIAIGTPAYLSPEQASGERELDGRSDIYALGCVLYEMLAGEPPFTGPTVESIVHQHIASAPPEVTGLRPSVPETVVDTIIKSLAKAPADRHRTAEELGAELTTEQVTISVSTVAARSKPPVRLLAAVGGLAVVIAVIIGFSVRERLSTPTHQRTAIAVLPFSPRWARAYLELVEGMLLNGDYGEASDLCEQVLDSFPTFAPAAVGLLQAGALMGNSTLAERGARRAWQLRDSLSVRDREFVAVFLDLSPEYPQPSTHSQFVETSEALITSYLSEATAATAVGDVEGAVRAYLRYLSLLSHRTDLDPALMSDIDRARTELARPNERQ